MGGGHFPEVVRGGWDASREEWGHGGQGHGGHRGEFFTGVTIFQRFMFTTQICPVSHSGTLSG